jgi:D-lyxose ketol-isomerase
MTDYVNPEKKDYFIKENDKEFMLKNKVWNKAYNAEVYFAKFMYKKVVDKRVLYVITDIGERPFADSGLAILKMENGREVQVLSDEEFDEKMRIKSEIEANPEVVLGLRGGGKSRRRKSRKVRRTIRRRRFHR